MYWHWLVARMHVPVLQGSRPWQSAPVVQQPSMTPQALLMQEVQTLLPRQSAGVRQQPGMARQPWMGSQPFVQFWGSSHVSGVPGMHTPSWHISVPLQASLSVHPGVTPFGPEVIVHRPPAHVSTVHGLPSLQSASALQCLGMHSPVGGSHTCPAGQVTSVPWWQPTPGVQVSAPLQALWSLGQTTGVCVQPVLASQASSVHTLPSSQSGGGPPAQVPSAQVSPVVQGLVSSHAVRSATGSLMHPNTGSQLSAVQALASTQPAGWRVWQWMSHVGQPGGAHCCGNTATVWLMSQAGQGTRQPAGVSRAVQTGLAQPPAQGPKGGTTAFEPLTEGVVPIG